MRTALKAELRKMLSVRSTYGIIVLTLLFSVGLAAFLIFGYNNVANGARNPSALLSTLVQAVNLGSFILAFIAILAVGHEYRYNTMLYTMTVTNNRAKIFASKLLATTIVILLAGAVTVGMAIGGFFLGQNMAGIATVTQTMPGVSEAWRYATVIAATAIIAYIIALLVRSQIMAIAAFLVVPTFIESLLMLLLKGDTKYLPFSAMNNLLAQSASVSYGLSVAVIAAYVAGLGLIAWLLFWWRDAN